MGFATGGAFVDVNTLEGQYLARTIDVLRFEKIRPRATLGILWDVANKNQANQVAGEVFVEEIIIGTVNGVLQDHIRIVYSDRTCPIFPILISEFINIKLADHDRALALLPDSELRT